MAQGLSKSCKRMTAFVGSETMKAAVCSAQKGDRWIGYAAVKWTGPCANTAEWFLGDRTTCVKIGRKGLEGRLAGQLGGGATG